MGRLTKGIIFVEAGRITMSVLRHSRRSSVRWLTLILGLVTVVLMTAASFPGPWHEHEEGPSQECQCPVCKIVNHGLLHSFDTVQLERPSGSVFLVPTEQPSFQFEAFANDQPARAPPV
jgi:hypothetical protein